MLKDIGRVRYVSSTDDEAINGFLTLSRLEGIIPALEPSHAIHYAIKLAKQMRKDEVVVITLSGRGDKDVQLVQDYLARKEKKNRHVRKK